MGEDSSMDMFDDDVEKEESEDKSESNHSSEMNKSSTFDFMVDYHHKYLEDKPLNFEGHFVKVNPIQQLNKKKVSNPNNTLADKYQFLTKHFPFSKEIAVHKDR